MKGVTVFGEKKRLQMMRIQKRKKKETCFPVAISTKHYLSKNALWKPLMFSQFRLCLDCCSTVQCVTETKGARRGWKKKKQKIEDTVGCLDSNRREMNKSLKIQFHHIFWASLKLKSTHSSMLEQNLWYQDVALSCVDSEPPPRSPPC